jgi:HEPN domain-containing protein
MKPIIREWVEKAEGDYKTANREFRARKDPNYDAVCFHCQQCAEKYLKALLQESEIPFKKSHNLIYLLDLIVPVASQMEIYRSDLKALNTAAVDARYPGESADKEKAKMAITVCRQVRQIIRSRLGLKS